MAAEIMNIFLEISFEQFVAADDTALEPLDDQPIFGRSFSAVVIIFANHERVAGNRHVKALLHSKMAMIKVVSGVMKIRTISVENIAGERDAMARQLDSSGIHIRRDVCSRRKENSRSSIPVKVISGDSP